jgi:hypothetical protein
MSNALQTPTTHDEIERHAYNVAFYELGLRWHWDTDTYRMLLQRSQLAAERVRLYLESAQPHLLKAYDAEFLAAAIENMLGKVRARCAAGMNVNWAGFEAAEIGA